MKQIFLWFMLCFFVIATVHAETPSPAPTTTETQPTFHPPEKNEGPVFPIEELLKKPSEQNDKFYSELLGMLATLGLILAFILLAAWFLKRLMNTRLEQINTTSLIKIVERRSLSAKTAIYLLEVNNKEILIAETHNGVTPLAEFPASTETKPPFSQLLDKK